MSFMLLKNYSSPIMPLKMISFIHVSCVIQIPTRQFAYTGIYKGYFKRKRNM